MANQVGPLIKQARTAAGLTQEQLAKKIPGVTASDISKAERGEAELTQAALKEIAKITGVTQKSLLDAAKASTGKTSSGKTGAAKTSSAKTAAKTSSSSKDTLTLTAAEKKLVELYRAADSDTKKAALQILKGETPEAGDILSSLLGSAVNLLGKK